MSVQQLNSINKNFTKYLTKVNKAVNLGLNTVANDILLDSNAIVPVKYGELLRSGEVVKDPQKMEYYVTYFADYAIFVHEDLNNYHPNGRAKFLLISMLKNAEIILQTIKEKI